MTRLLPILIVCGALLPAAVYGQAPAPGRGAPASPRGPIYSSPAPGTAARAPLPTPATAAPAPNVLSQMPSLPALMEELRELHRLMEQQTKQLQLVSDQLSQMRMKQEQHSEAPAAAAEPAPDTAPTPAGEPAPEPPHAEATGGGIKHIVAKGETLTSIAKHYNIPVADLHKANKIKNDRALQIGQVLSIPASSSPTPEPAPAPEKKETP